MELSLLTSAAGSGIPEVRTMLAGIEMPPYLSLTNMFAKFLGVICTLAAGTTVFMGKVVRDDSADKFEMQRTVQVCHLGFSSQIGSVCASFYDVRGLLERPLLSCTRP